MTTNESLFWLAMNAYHEARGEAFDGIKAVCHVVLNRARLRKKTVKEIVLQPWQFSWANNGARPAVKDYDAFANCLSAAIAVCDEQEAGKNLFGSDHYHTVKRPPGVEAWPPSWASKMTKTTTIGSHVFYKA